MRFPPGRAVQTDAAFGSMRGMQVGQAVETLRHRHTFFWWKLQPGSGKFPLGVLSANFHGNRKFAIAFEGQLFEWAPLWRAAPSVRQRVDHVGRLSGSPD